MERSSAPGNGRTLPEGVNESDLVEGPAVAHLPSGKGTFLAPEALVKPIPIGGRDSAAAIHTELTEVTKAAYPHIPPATTADIKKEYPAVLELALDVLSARLLGLIALVTACAIWAFVVYDPIPWRILGAGVFSVLVFGPIMVIYWRRMSGGEA